MAVLKKTVHNLQPVCSKSLEEIIGNCLQHLGAGLFCSEQDRLKNGSGEDNNPVSVKELPNIFNDKYGEVISFNLSNITFEKDIQLFDSDGTPFADHIQIIALEYMKAELNEENKNRMKEYNNFIKKVLYPQILKIDLKILRIGELEYFFYVI